MAFKELGALLEALEQAGEQFDFVGTEPAEGPWLTYPRFVGTLAKDMGTMQLDMAHMAVGVSGEAGELLDAIKKYWVYNKPLDRTNVIEELGDLEFYLAGMRLLLGVTRDQVLEANYEKLKVRYADGYSDEAAQQRADKLVVIDPTVAPAPAPAVLSTEQVSAVDETAGLVLTDEFEEMPNWLKELVTQFGPNPYRAVLSWNVSSSGVRGTVLFEGEAAPKFFYKPKDES